MKQTRSISIASIVAMSLLLVLPAFGADSSAVERQWPFPAALVKRNLEHLRAYDGSRLPTLEGFVADNVKNLELYEQPYYQYRLTLTPVDEKTTVLRVEAKITALYANTHTAHSEYKTLPSNGRLEADLLDRLSRALPTVTASGAVRAETIPENPVARNTSTTDFSPPPASTHVAVGIGSAPPAITAATNRAASPAAPEQELDQVLAERREAQQKSADIHKQIEQMQATGTIQQVSLGSVRHSGVGVMSRTNYGGPVLFRAQADDEFEIAEVQGEWTKVHLAGGATGYIESDELVLPAGVQRASVTTPAAETAGPASPKPVSSNEAPSPAKPAQQPDLGFWISREEVTGFSGEWSRLKGKQVLYVYAQPRGLLSDLASDDKKLAFAKRTFETRLQKVGSSNLPYEGVVVVFIGSKGGVAAATLGDIRQWVDGGLDDRAFMSRCSLDLPGNLGSSRAN